MAAPNISGRLYLTNVHQNSPASFSFITKVVFLLSKAYVLDHSGSFDIHIEKCKKKKRKIGVRKNGFYGTEGGGAPNFADWSANNLFIFPIMLMNLLFLSAG